MKKELVSALSTVLSDTVVLKYKVQGAHWNVVGIDFHQFHAFFEEIYLEVDSAIDPIAEQIRTLGASAPFRLAEFSELSNIDQPVRIDSTSRALVQEIHTAIEIALKDIDHAFDLANQLGEQGVVGLLAQREDMLKKWRWQLESALAG
ncbi:Dps family protein [Candidatus Aquiluna sp. UB-MaderosW2red]|uniref:Dps family protein n=1 Tax=Candidatus Aquiluna sp. UB-MaderosW2red TaxID=1855377 RepID=UPI000875C8F5|nr:DNA starvation/stationary phase protection protein [Candidatus Aquiluna sp. UB-MaderosW2red]SCX15033.1 starvation-inducible DNA-binding protein [Candidatus Aquiluna sp. UB-MaderosW2red]